MIDQISALTSLSADGVLKSTETRFMSKTANLGANAGPADANFTDVMASVTQDTIDKIKQGEAAALSGVDGQASVQQVVEAVMAAETSLQTAIAIREKVVNAYQEIARMTI